MQLAFPIAEEPDQISAEKGRLLFAGETEFLKGVVAMSGLPPADRMEVCFAGRSNVGKSSLINALTGRKGLARASNTPGRTQGINFFTAGESHYLVDLPGYGYANAPLAVVEKWQKLLKQYLSGRQSLRRVFVLIDARHGVKAVDEEIMSLLDSSAVTFQAVLTKTDKVKEKDREKVLAQVREKLEMFARDVVLMQMVGVNPVVVHGGGPMINAMLDKLDIQSEFVNGKRVTDEATVEVVEMVLSGRVNKRIVQAINAQGGKAVGLSGKDANLVVCDQTNPDLGFVGTPTDIDPSVLESLFENNTIPVIAPLGAGRDGETFNINGDTMAGAIAGALNADRLLLLTDVPGVKNAKGDVVTELKADQIREMIADGTVAGGMIPKTETALDALENGVRAVVILDGRAPNACLLELYTEHGAGSLIRG